jgi:hypothetical protein
MYIPIRLTDTAKHEPLHTLLAYREFGNFSAWEIQA